MSFNDPLSLQLHTIAAANLHIKSLDSYFESAALPFFLNFLLSVSGKEPFKK